MLQATVWDRAFGGSTMILHIDGTTQPNTPVQPEYMKAHVYLPPSFIAENPHTHNTIARLVQTFIEEVGVPTIARWKRAATALGWKLLQPGRPTAPNSSSLPLIPSSASSHYVFPGRPYGSLNNSATSFNNASSYPSSPTDDSSSTHSFGSNDFTRRGPDDSVLALMERYAELEVDLQQAKERLADAQNEAAKYQKKFEDASMTNASLTIELIGLGAREFPSAPAHKRPSPSALKASTSPSEAPFSPSKAFSSPLKTSPSKPSAVPSSLGPAKASVPRSNYDMPFTQAASVSSWPLASSASSLSTETMSHIPEPVSLFCRLVFSPSSLILCH
jgi:hypothetical protein